LRTAEEICEGLSFAHKNRIIHGNLRPSNILFTQSGIAKIADFGIQEHYADRETPQNWYSVSGEEKSPKTDIYSAGVIFHQMLTGNPNFEKAVVLTLELLSFTLIAHVLVGQKKPFQGAAVLSYIVCKAVSILLWWQTLLIIPGISPAGYFVQSMRVAFHGIVILFLMNIYLVRIKEE
jgi:serine/threonine protein kinase